MVAIVNQCTLSQTDFDFITKANLVTELTDKIQMTSDSPSVSLFFAFLIIIVPVSIMVIAVMIRSYDKVGSNIFLIISLLATCIVALLPYSDFNKTDAIDVQLHEAKAELKTMEKPDVEIVDACSHPDVILKLAPNRDDVGFKSSYEVKDIAQ